ncbi:tryptophan synthase subunit alpha [Flavobacteriaceae bacterium]|nr:tryptophan synthase subunit alpha [Flavobacteriaceae bacterium]
MNYLKRIIKEKEGPVCSLFFTAGFPELNDTKKHILELQEAGVDFIEVGMPYSDPMADGPTIQDSSDIALANGMNLDVLFDQLEECKDQVRTPLVLMGYFNQLLKYGEDRFLQRAEQAGIKTVILPDLPMIEYENVYKDKFAKYGISNVFLVTPQTAEERILKIDQMTESFIYVVASASITGTKGTISDEQIDYFKRIKAMKLKNPQIVGFGISDRHTLLKANEYLDGAIIGSAYIRALKKGQGEAFVKSLLN